MQWIGKAVGGILGFATGGPLGSVLGLVVGHRIDQGYAARFGAGGVATASEETRLFFFQVAFEVMGRVAKLDGRVSEEEIRAVRRVMHAMELRPEQVSRAIDAFTAGKSAEYPLAERLAELKRRVTERRDLAAAFVEIQVQAALGAGGLGRLKRQFLWRVASDLGMGRVEFAQIEALVRAQQIRAAALGSGEATQVDTAYRVLGVSSEASDGEVKKAYRRLMNQHHPDKLVSRGLPKSRVVLAEQRTQEIRAAYERIKAHRAFK
ncbi:MAG TPA: co-chaperone DjlA [Gammaproteobacteria bacterium]|nr:co-chaperone DjlA [Gammaproteobacteria bacterium]